MSSDGERKLSPAEIAYPTNPEGDGDGYVDYYVGERKSDSTTGRSTAKSAPFVPESGVTSSEETPAVEARPPAPAEPPPKPPEPEVAVTPGPPEPVAEATPTITEEPSPPPVVAEKEPETISDEPATIAPEVMREDPPPVDNPPPTSGGGGIPSGVWILAVLALVAGVYMFRGGPAADSNDSPTPPSVPVIKIVSNPPGLVYRRQLELGETPLEVSKDDNGVPLTIRLDGYKDEIVTFDGVTAGEVQEIKVTLQPDGTEPTPEIAETPVASEPTPEVTETPVVISEPTPEITETPVIATEPTPQVTETPTVATEPTPKIIETPAVATEPTPEPEPVAAKPPPKPVAQPPRRPQPVYRPPPRRPYRPPARPRDDGHRIKPPVF